MKNEIRNKEKEQGSVEPRTAQDCNSGQGLEEVRGIISVWDKEAGCLFLVKNKDGWEEAIDGVNCSTDGMHYEFNLQGRRTIVSVDDSCKVRLGDTDGFEEVQ